MKISCPFCKTEYDVPATRGPFACACCGHVWRAAARRRIPFLWLMSVLCLALALGVFAGVVFMKNRAADTARLAPLVIQITSVRTVSDAFGAPHFVVSGAVRNQSGEIYGVPDLVIILRDADGTEVARQKFLAPAPLLDADESIEFTHTVAESVPNAAKASVEFFDHTEK